MRGVKMKFTLGKSPRKRKISSLLIVKEGLTPFGAPLGGKITYWESLLCSIGKFYWAIRGSRRGRPFRSWPEEFFRVPRRALVGGIKEEDFPDLERGCNPGQSFSGEVSGVHKSCGDIFLGALLR